MNKIIFGLLIPSLFLLSQTLYAGIYKSIDKDGNVTYSGDSINNSKEIKIKKNLTTYSPYQYNKNNKTKTSKSKQAIFKKYQHFSISSPTKDQTFNNTGGVISVAINIEPPLKKNHIILANVNGVTRPKKFKSTQFNIDDLFRGSHTISVKVVNKKGQLLNSSETVSIFVKQHSILH